MGLSQLKPTGKVGVARGRAVFGTSEATLFLLIGCVSFGFLVQPALSNGGAPGPQSAQGDCTTSADDTTCSCEAAAASRGAITSKDLAATLSEQRPNLNLTCSATTFTAAPPTMDKGNVCPETATLEECTKAQPKQRETSVIQLNSLLSKGTASVSLVNVPEGSKKKYSVAIPEDAFPLVDSKFAVGCKVVDTAGCKVSVTLQARKSATAGQTVTCAYGSASNEKRQSVTLTPSNNKLTISCGKGGTLLPGNGANCCAYDETSAADKCNTQPFTDIFPGYKESWWNNEVANNQATLTVPAEEFVDDRKFLVGCKHTPTAEALGTRDGPAVPQSPGSPSVCTVEVTVKKQPTTTTTSSTSSASVSHSLFLPGSSGSIVAALLSCGLYFHAGSYL